MAGQHLGQRAFSRTIRPHDRVHLAARHEEAQPAHNLLIADRDMQILYVQFIHKSE